MMNKQANNKRMNITRRDLLKLGATAGIAGLIAAGGPLVASVSGKAPAHGGPPHDSPESTATIDDGMGMAHGDNSGTMGEVDLTQIRPQPVPLQF